MTAKATTQRQSAGLEVTTSSAIKDEALFVVDGTLPLAAAVERALDNGSGEVLVRDASGRISGVLTLERARILVRDGTFSTARAQDAAGALDSGRLTAQLDRNGRLASVAFDRSKSFVPVAEPHLTSAEYRNLMDAFLSTWISSTGEYIGKFEGAFAARCEVKHGVAVSNGTVAIHLALLALGIGPGHEVIVPDFTFAATINTVVMAGATPVIVDVDPETWCMSPEALSKAITRSTRAIIPVHVFGRPAPMTEICRVASDHGLYVIEDCAEAHGAAYDGKPVGSFSDVATFSFFANKIITTGEGGMCLTNSPLLAERMRILRDHGMRPERRYWHEEVGYNYRMTNLQAAIGCAQLSRLTAILAQRQAVQDLYAERFAGLAGVKMPPKLPARFQPVAWFACATVPLEKRDALILACRKASIDLRPFFNGLSIMPAYKSWSRPCPVSRSLSARGVNLPTSHYVDGVLVDRLVSAFQTVLS